MKINKNKCQIIIFEYFFFLKILLKKPAIMYEEISITFNNSMIVFLRTLKKISYKF